MAITQDTYGSIQAAADYFAMRLHEHAWSRAVPADRRRGLRAATLIIDTLNFKGHKHSVYELLESNPAASDDQVRAAEAAQVQEFPRGADNLLPRPCPDRTYRQRGAQCARVAIPATVPSRRRRHPTE